MKIKPLIWIPGPLGLYNRRVNFDIATTPFGTYKAWHSDGELWGPTPGSMLIGRYGDIDSAKAAAYEHLCAGIAELVELSTEKVNQ